MIHSGTKGAIPLFSYAVTPNGNVPSSIPIKALTGNSSPSCLAIGLWISFMNLGRSSFISLSSSSSSFDQEEGTSTLVKPSNALSIALMFLSTISLPFFPYISSTFSFRYSKALLIGITLASLKNADCITILILFPNPTSLAILIASII